MEYSPYYQPKALVKFCHDNNIIVARYRCLAKGEACKDPSIVSLAKKYGSSVVDILSTWSISHDVCPIYSTNNPDHLKVTIVHMVNFT